VGLWIMLVSCKFVFVFVDYVCVFVAYMDYGQSFSDKDHCIPHYGVI